MENIDVISIYQYHCEENIDMISILMFTNVAIPRSRYIYNLREDLKTAYTVYSISSWKNSITRELPSLWGV